MADFFNANKKNNLGPGFKVVDGSDAYANEKGLLLRIEHVASGLDVMFKAFITQYNENFDSNYTPEEVFGRFDPIMTFQNTKRSFSVQWDIPAFSIEEAKINLAKCNRLAQFMYPAYDRQNQANTISKPPLMRIKFANLIRNAANNGGLLVAVGGLVITPDFAADGAGFFDPGSETLYPKNISINLTNLTVLHEHQIGWGAEIGFNDDAYTQYPFGQTDGVFEAPSSRNQGNEVSQQVTSEQVQPQITEAPVVETNAADEENIAAETIQVGDLSYDESGQEILYTPAPENGDAVGYLWVPDDTEDYGGSW